jgi:hypothetical protein
MRVIQPLLLIGTLVLGSSRGMAVEPLRFDFEEETTDWFPSENDPGTAGVAIGHVATAASGKQALAIRGRFPDSVGASYTPWQDWRPYGTLKLAVYIPGTAPKDLSVYLYLKDKQYLWYQTGLFRATVGGKAVLTYKPGQWNTATVDLSPTSKAWEPAGHRKSWYRSLYYPREFGVRFFSRTPWEGALFVDDIQLIPLAQPVVPPARPLKLERNAAGLPCYGKFELTFPVDREYDNPFNPWEVDVTGHFRAPSGQETAVPGFFYQGYERTQDDAGNEKLIPIGPPSWKVRFAAREPGRYAYHVTLKDSRGEVRSPDEAFEATPSPDPRGMVRVSQADPRYFEFENGEFFYPQGINMRDGGNQAAAQRGTYAFDEYLPAFRDAGLSFVRTWMCAWWAGIEWSDKYDSRYDNLGRYCMYNAWRLDYALEQAEANDLFVELTLNSHGQLRRDKFDAEWEYNPYAAANGGPCLTPSQFWSNPTAREMVRRRYRYIAARWGYSRHIMSWDLWNEIDLIDAYGQLSPDVAAWHNEMSQVLRDVDPLDHLITTHYCLHFMWDSGRSLWAVPGIDYAQADAYWPQKHIGDDISRGFGARLGLRKPYWVIEFGPQTTQVVANNLTPHQIEAYYRIGLWTSVVVPMASPAHFWYHDLWKAGSYARHNQALAKFIAGEDRRGRNWTWINHDPKQNPLAPTTNPPTLYVQAMKSPQATYCYLFDLDRMYAGDAARQLSPIQGATVDLRTIPNGDYDVEFWEPYTGEVTGTAAVTVVGGRAQIALPDFLQDLACKLRLRPAP